jgi:hypothetical protein
MPATAKTLSMTLDEKVAALQSAVDALQAYDNATNAAQGHANIDAAIAHFKTERFRAREETFVPPAGKSDPARRRRLLNIVTTMNDARRAEALVRQTAFSDTVIRATGFSSEALVTKLTALATQQHLAEIGFSDDDAKLGYPVLKQTLLAAEGKIQKAYETLKLHGSDPEVRARFPRDGSEAANAFWKTFEHHTAHLDAYLREPSGFPSYIVGLDQKTGQVRVHRILSNGAQEPVTDPAVLDYFQRQQGLPTEQQRKIKQEEKEKAERDARERKEAKEIEQEEARDPLMMTLVPIGLAYGAFRMGKNLAPWLVAAGLVGTFHTVGSKTFFFAHTFADDDQTKHGRITLDQTGDRAALSFTKNLSLEQALTCCAIANDKGWTGLRLTTNDLSPADCFMLVLAMHSYAYKEARVALKSGAARIVLKDGIPVMDYAAQHPALLTRLFKPKKLFDEESPTGKFDIFAKPIQPTSELESFFWRYHVKPDPKTGLFTVKQLHHVYAAHLLAERDKLNRLKFEIAGLPFPEEQPAPKPKRRFFGLLKGRQEPRHAPKPPASTAPVPPDVKNRPV